MSHNTSGEAPGTRSFNPGPEFSGSSSVVFPVPAKAAAVDFSRAAEAVPAKASPEEPKRRKTLV